MHSAVVGTRNKCQHCRVVEVPFNFKALNSMSLLILRECEMVLQERRRVALKLVNVTDAYFGTMTSRGWLIKKR